MTWVLWIWATLVVALKWTARKAVRATWWLTRNILKASAVLAATLAAWYWVILPSTFFCQKVYHRYHEVPELRRDLDQTDRVVGLQANQIESLEAELAKLRAREAKLRELLK